MRFQIDQARKLMPASPTTRVAIGAFLISFSPVFVRVAEVGPATVAFYRLSIGGVALVVLAAAMGRVRRIERISLIFAVLCGLLIAVDLSVWHLSIRLVGPGLATILGNHQVFVLSLFGVLFLGERITMRLALAILLAVSGLFMVFGLDWAESGSDFKLGIFFGVLTAVMYGSFLLLLRYTQQRRQAPDSIVTVAILSIVGATTLSIYVWFGGESFVVPTTATWVTLFAYAFLCHVIGWVLISRGLPHLEASRAGLVLLLQPALAFVWDVLLFHRPTSSVELLGAVLALGAIYLGSTRNARTAG